MNNYDNHNVFSYRKINYINVKVIIDNIFLMGWLFVYKNITLTFGVF